MHKRLKKLFFWLCTILNSIVIVLFVCIPFIADISTWYNRALHAVFAAFFIWVEMQLVSGVIRQFRETDSRIWSPDRSTRKKKRNPKKLSKK